MHFFLIGASNIGEVLLSVKKSNQGPELHNAHLSEDVKFNCIDSRSFYCYLITDKSLIVLISDHNFVFIQFSPRSRLF